MIKRLINLQLILLGGLGSVFLLPKDLNIQPAAVETPLPEFINDWQGVDQPVNQGERDVLGPDTQFDRKLYTRGTDQIFVSVVRSGPDMNTSIHRPERCMPAQGWTITNTDSDSVPIGSGVLRATRLHIVRAVPLQSGQTHIVQGINYYWFIGNSNVTASHYERTWIDIRDRILKGRNQQWAYVTVASTITKDFRIFGRDENQTDAMIREFLTHLVPQLQRIPLSPPA